MTIAAVASAATIKHLDILIAAIPIPSLSKGDDR
jgi:hypothetical protein